MMTFSNGPQVSHKCGQLVQVPAIRFVCQVDPVHTSRVSGRKKTRYGLAFVRRKAAKSSYITGFSLRGSGIPRFVKLRNSRTACGTGRRAEADIATKTTAAPASSANRIPLIIARRCMIPNVQRPPLASRAEPQRCDRIVPPHQGGEASRWFGGAQFLF